MSILRMPAVKAETGHASHASIYTAIHEGLFTVPVSISRRSVGWPQNEVKAINAAHIRGDSEEKIKALVAELHHARMEGTDKPFTTDWFDRSAMLKKQAAKRTIKCKRTTQSKAQEVQA